MGHLWPVRSAEGLLYGPRDVAIDSEGKVFVTDTGNKRIMVYDRDGNYVTQMGYGGAGPGEFAEPVGIAVDAGGQSLCGRHLEPAGSGL